MINDGHKNITQDTTLYVQNFVAEWLTTFELKRVFVFVELH